MNIFYTAPTAIRTFIKWGDEWPKKHDLDSLRLLGTVGEPINPEAWMWYREVIGKDRCPIVDTWWQTETGHIMISARSRARSLPSRARRRVLFRGGCGGCQWRQAGAGRLGRFSGLKQPWPGMLRTIYGDPDRYVQQYWSQIPPTTSPATAPAKTKTATSG